MSSGRIVDVRRVCNGRAWIVVYDRRSGRVVVDAVVMIVVTALVCWSGRCGKLCGVMVAVVVVIHHGCGRIKAFVAMTWSG